MGYVIVIPAYEPDISLLKLTEELILRKLFSKIIIVNDGSSGSDLIFDSLKKINNVVVLRNDINLGKGASLKKAFRYIKSLGSEYSVITADADGQHLIEDILRVKDALNPQNSAVIGVRSFQGKVPFRSFFGNFLTKLVFFITSLNWVKDTQTGLRGFSHDVLDQLVLQRGERYEYETQVLLSLFENKIDVRQIDIDTIYVDDNKNSHFNPIIDSFKIYFVFIRYCFVAITSFMIDIVIFYIFISFGQNLLLSTYCARVFSASYNFTMNKIFSFKNKEVGIKWALIKYVSVAAMVASASGTLLTISSGYSEKGFSVVLIKIIIDLILFLISFILSKYFIYR